MVPLTGSCQCGDVKFKLIAEPLITVACHCTECQTFSSSAFSFSTLARREDFIVEGELKQYDRPMDRGGTARNFFCPNCGNRIFHDSGAEKPDIRIKGRFDQENAVRPRIQLWCRSRQSWLGLLGGGVNNLPAFDTQPDSRTVVRARILLGYAWRIVKLTFLLAAVVCIFLVLSRPF